MDYLEVEGSPVSRHTRFYYTDRLEREILRLTLAQEPGQGFAYNVERERAARSGAGPRPSPPR